MKKSLELWEFKKIEQNCKNLLHKIKFYDRIILSKLRVKLSFVIEITNYVLIRIEIPNNKKKIYNERGKM